MSRAWFALIPFSLWGLLGCGGGHDHEHWSPYPSLISRAVVASDLNRDGRMDVATLGVWNDTGEGVLTLRYGAAIPPTEPVAFEAPVRVRTGLYPQDLVAADLGGQGSMSLLVADEGLGTPGVQVYSQNAGGQFQPGPRISLGRRIPRRLAVGDLNGDGRPDLAIAADGEASLLVAYQQGDGGFSIPIALPTDGIPTAVAIAAIPAGGSNAIVAATEKNKVILLAPNTPPAAGFTSLVSFDVGLGPRGVSVADLDGDGRLDILTANQVDGSVSVWLQPAGPTFDTVKAISYDALDYLTVAVTVADVNGDGRPEVVTANAGAPGQPGSLSIFGQDPAHLGQLQRPARYQGSWGPNRVVLIDINGDRLPDLVTADGNPSIRLQDAGHPGTFLPTIFLRQ